MKQLLLLCFLLVSKQFVSAQDNDWFKRTWFGTKTFANAHIAIKASVRIEIDSVFGNIFLGRFIYMYPKDTVARLVQSFNGSIKGKYININKIKEIYLLDPRSRSFWSDCSQCDETTSVSLSDSNIVLKIATINCGDSCNSETVFSKSINSFDSSAQLIIAKLFKTDDNADQVSLSSKQKNKKIKIKDKGLIDTIRNDQSLIKPDAISEIKKTNILVKADTVVLPVRVLNTDTLPQAIITRKTNLINTYQVSSPHIQVELFDNGEIDYDAVSVYYNNKLIINNQTLTHKAITFNIDASVINRHHEFILIAENEGMIPPNTALLRITAGSEHFELSVSTSSSNNAKIAIDYTGE